MPKPRRADAAIRAATVIDCLKADLRRGWTVSEMSGLLGVSEAQLRRIFADGGNSSPKRLLADLRLQVAADLLDDPRMRVKEVIDRVGITDVSHFCRDFRQRFGMSPTAFRARRSLEQVRFG